MASDPDDEGEVTLGVGLKYGLGLIGLGIGMLLFLMILETSPRALLHWREMDGRRPLLADRHSVHFSGDPHAPS